MKRSFWSVVAIGCALAIFLAAFSAGTVLAGETVLRLRVELKATDDGGDAEGKAEWKEETDGRLRFRVDVQDVETDGTGTVTVRRDGEVVFEADIKIDDGDGRLELDSDDGDEVPVLQEGDVVEVSDSDDVLVLTGKLKED